MDVFRSALSLVIHKNNDVSDADIDDLLSHYRRKKGIDIDRHKYKETVEAASKLYKQYENCLFICTGKSCIKKTLVNPSDVSTAELSKELNYPVMITGCHWLCDQAPVVTVKAGTNTKSFIERDTEQSWQEVRDYIACVQNKEN